MKSWKWWISCLWISRNSSPSGTVGWPLPSVSASPMSDEVEEGVRLSMIKYKAGYKFVGGGVHAQVLDFQEAISCGADLGEARRMLGSALLDVSETRLELGEPLPLPDPSATDPEMDLEEP